MSDWTEVIAKQLAVEDLPSSYQEIASLIGVENAVKLAGALGGMSYYFPQLETVLRRKRDEVIRREFTGANHRALAKKYNLSEVWIREIVEARTIENQPSLFEAFAGK